MKAIHFIRRLVIHGSRLLWRVGAILLPVIGVALWEMVSRALQAHADSSEREEIVAFSRTEAWEAFDAGKISAVEMSYYDEVYGDH